MAHIRPPRTVHRMTDRPPLPRKLRIGQHHYRIRTSDKARLEATGGDDRYIHGATNATTCDMYIDAVGQAPSQRRDTLLHEVLHAVLHDTGIAHELSHKREERLVRRLTPALLQALRDNPKLVAYLTDDS